MRTYIHILSKYLLATCLTFSLSALACLDISLPPNDSYTFQDKDLNVTAYDGTQIDINIFAPTTGEEAQSKKPAIIFINSWLLDDLQYLIPAKRFAKQGYVVLSYSTRGFGCSGGQVNVAAPEDIQDLSAVLDYLQSRNDVDMENVAVAGISYGSGIGLIGLAQDSRIKTAVAMSTWGSLIDSLYGQQTPRLFWGSLLTVTGSLFGNLDPSVSEIFKDLIHNRNIQDIRQWSALRSPLSYANLINERQAPVFIANNYGDALFNPNSVIEFYQSLTGPKRLELNQGTHFSGEGPGLFGFPNYTWDNIQIWLDFWLKGDNSQNVPREQVSILTDLKHKRELYPSLPQTEDLHLHLQPKGWFSDGKLKPNAYTRGERGNTILSGLDSGASTGIPALSALLDGNLKIPVKLPTFLMNRVNGILFKGDRLEEEMKIRGIPKLQLSISSSRPESQVIAYLYDLDAKGVGTLITHGPVSFHDEKRNSVIKASIDLNATAYDVPKGHRIALALDTWDFLYDVPTLVPYSLRFHFGRNHINNLALPVLAD